MLVVLTDEHVISPEQVCHSCLLADRSGHPRWRQGQLCCGHAIAKTDRDLPDRYECQMGFQLVNVN